MFQHVGNGDPNHGAGGELTEIPRTVFSTRGVSLGPAFAGLNSYEC